MLFCKKGKKNHEVLLQIGNFICIPVLIHIKGMLFSINNCLFLIEIGIKKLEI
ncbi:hypothetical protein AsAng_0054860 [Aureispira anguillae]|uniref:Uncharacterized protein n=1 Tax=Aureispira anguillae TaxID=2864201 RepID=A0A915YK39_9BACT|nr:hypothetical protein AsAng_0054860 [Aureispira anguillae]